MERKLVKKLEEIDEITQEELDMIINGLNKNKKYGLVWEYHSEDVDLDLKGGTFSIKEVEDKQIREKANGRENLLLEGDNLHSLMFMKEAGMKVDVIYIDPPYNTFNEERFLYNDKRIDGNDDYRHSKWISFMERRLRLARELLTDDGVIFVSIDDNEQANLKLLMDEIFGEENFIANLVWTNQEGGGSSDTKYFRIKHEYILVYGKVAKKSAIKGLPVQDEDRYRLTDEYLDERGPYQLIKLDSASLGYVESLDFPITSRDGEKIYPNKDDRKISRWRWGKEKVRWGFENDYIVIQKDREGDLSVYTKQYLNADNEGNIIERTIQPSGIINEFSTTQSNKKIKEIFGEVVFKYSKPVELIERILKISTNTDSTILDFFAGSGTTGQAVMELNKEDDGNRRFILATNNENNISEEITYERNKKVITGKWDKGDVDPIPNNLSYYKVGIDNKDTINFKEKLEADINNQLNMIVMKEELQITKDNQDYAVLEGIEEENVLFIKNSKMSDSIRNLNFKKYDYLFIPTILNRDKAFKSIDESKIKHY